MYINVHSTSTHGSYDCLLVEIAGHLYLSSESLTINIVQPKGSEYRYLLSWMENPIYGYYKPKPCAITWMEQFS